MTPGVAGVAWTYGDAGDRYPVAVGEGWQVGEHRLLCADLEDGAAQEIALLTRPAMLYTDPPWSAGLAKGYRTKAATLEPAIETHAVDYPALLSRVLEAAQHVRGDTFVEIGIHSAPLVRALAAEWGAEVRGDWATTYYGSKPCRLLHLVFFGSSGIRPTSATPEGLDEEAAVAWCIERATEPGQLVFDPFMGRGLVAEVAERYGRPSVGIELNPRRMAVTIDKLVEATGLEPVRWWP